MQLFFVQHYIDMLMIYLMILDIWHFDSIFEKVYIHCKLYVFYVYMLCLWFIDVMISSYAFLTVLIKLLKIFQEVFGRAGFHCDRQECLNLRYFLKTTFFESTSKGTYFSFTVYLMQHAQFSVDNVFKRWQNFMFYSVFQTRFLHLKIVNDYNSLILFVWKNSM